MVVLFYTLLEIEHILPIRQSNNTKMKWKKKKKWETERNESNLLGESTPTKLHEGTKQMSKFLTCFPSIALISEQPSVGWNCLVCERNERKVKLKRKHFHCCSLYIPSTYTLQSELSSAFPFWKLPVKSRKAFLLIYPSTQQFERKINCDCWLFLFTNFISELADVRFIYILSLSFYLLIYS